MPRLQVWLPGGGMCKKTINWCFFFSLMFLSLIDVSLSLPSLSLKAMKKHSQLRIKKKNTALECLTPMLPFSSMSQNKTVLGSPASVGEADNSVQHQPITWAPWWGSWPHRTWKSWKRSLLLTCWCKQFVSEKFTRFDLQVNSLCLCEIGTF